jgi:hypothetical protein
MDTDSHIQTAYSTILQLDRLMTAFEDKHVPAAFKNPSLADLTSKPWLKGALEGWSNCEASLGYVIPPNQQLMREPCIQLLHGYAHCYIDLTCSANCPNGARSITMLTVEHLPSPVSYLALPQLQYWPC